MIIIIDVCLHQRPLKLLGSFLEDGELDSFLLREGDHGCVVLSDDEDVAESGSERVVDGVLDGDDVEGSRVAFDVLDGSDASAIASLGDHAGGAKFELDEVDDLARGEVDLGDVVDANQGVRVSDGLSVVRRHDRDLFLGHVDVVDAAQLEADFVVLDAVQHEPALGVVKQTERLARRRKRHHVHETGRKGRIRANLVVHLDVLRHAYHLSFLTRDRILQTVAQDQHERKTLAKLVRAARWTRSERAVHLAQHPVLRSIHSLQMFLWAARHPVALKN